MYEYQQSWVDILRTTNVFDEFLGKTSLGMITVRVYLLVFAFYAPILSAEQAIDPHVSDIVTIGYWEQDHQRGQYRFITKTYGLEHVFSKLYIQWLTHPEAGEFKGRVVAEEEVTELNTQYYSFTSPECVGEWKCQAFTLLATHSFTHKNHIFKITVQGLGRYSITE